jgi:uncharacterized membrane protein
MTKSIGKFLRSSIVEGLLIILPIGLLVLIFIKLAGMVEKIADPLTQFLPESLRFPALTAALLLVLLAFVIGVLANTRHGRRVGRYVEKSTLSKIPGYSFMKDLTHSIGREDKEEMAPAFVEIEEALVLAFIIEVHEDGQYTVFVPSTPTPAAGTVYVIEAARVHLLDVPFIEAIKSVSRFGAGSAELMKSLRVPFSMPKREE